MPALIGAYGKRVSAILLKVGSGDAAPGNTKAWIFSQYLGVDVASIWAAATSSESALLVHLLACMLARIWNEAEAILLWAEIIEGR